MEDNNNYIRGRRRKIPIIESAMSPDMSMMIDSEIDDILDKFNAVPLINPIPISEIEKIMETIN